MSVIIKALTTTTGAPVLDKSLAAQNDFFNLLQTPNVVYDIYSPPNDATAKRAAIVKAIRIANTHTANVKITLYVNRPNASGLNRRRLLTPADMTLGPNQVYVDESELTLEPGDKIQAKADVGSVIQYWITGLERD